MGYSCRVAALAVCGLFAFGTSIGCGSSSSSSGGAPASNGGGSGDLPNFGGAPPVGPSAQYENGLTQVGQIPAPASKLPAVAEMTNLIAIQGQDGASITFDPVDGALDYRVYVLPADGDITVAGDKSVVIANGTYRCAGNHEAPPVYADGEKMIGGQGIHTRVDGQKIGEYTRTMADATLGYVFTRPSAGLVPVYALGVADANADNSCFFGRYQASRTKKYTTSEDERKQLIAARYRDDGIAFYVPAAADATTVNISMDEKDTGTMFTQRYYVPDGAEGDTHPNKVLAFPVLAQAAPGSQPLMRVFYESSCGWSHDELAVGKERFNRIYHQGDKLPEFKLEWSGYDAPTTLVVEALDVGCPYPGFVAPQAQAAVSVPFAGRTIDHQPWVSFDDARTASPTKELFLNGQFATGNKPKAIARGYIKVSPSAHPKMDFFDTFANGSMDEAFTTVPCGVDNCYQTWRQQSATFDQMFIDAESSKKMGDGLFAYGRQLGQWYFAYSDVAADTNGKYRLTANQKATLSSGKYLHVTMEVDSYSTARRYPQIIISTSDAPVQYGLEKNHNLIVQPRAQINEALDFPVSYELQVCNLRTWDVNNQCPVYDLYHVMEGGKVKNLAPNDEVGEHATADHRVLYDVFTSTDRTYLFLDGQPYGCAILPPSSMPEGPVTVTWGDALYHSDVDHVYAFHEAHMKIEQRRHFDNIGFSSGVSAPNWDESILPCASPISL